jgi:nitroimidazol reductase NimA-like FMN-containing flavoprotein (pyridoxamine 5'-phosphate oxidase superfamily)
MTSFEPLPHTTIKRHADRGDYDRQTVYDILDSMPLAHVGFIDHGRPVVIPTLQVRIDDKLYLHGSRGGRRMRIASAGAPLSISVAIMDGLVLARSIANTSMNYRSVVLFGQGTEIDELDRKRAVLKHFTDRLMPGRWDDARQPNDDELRATAVVGVPIVEASAKVRTGGPVDEAEDMQMANWAGIVPLHNTFGAPELADDSQFEGDLPAYLRELPVPGR